MSKATPSVVIIGAGMTGILLAIRLAEAGIVDITILEKEDDVGGTWRENRYPGVACDVPAHAYTYSFAPNPEWSHRFANGSQIHKYFRDVFLDYDLDRITKFNEPVTSCVFTDNEWHVTTPKHLYIADLVFSATGILHHPVTPDIPGLDTFKGPVMHTARWDKSVQIHNKNVGVIGTGSTGSQVIPALADTQGTSVTVFQRTPQWIIYAKNKYYSTKELATFASNPTEIERIRKIASKIYSWGTSALTSITPYHKVLHYLMSLNARGYLYMSIRDSKLREQLTPDYKFGCKRVVMNDTFYPAMKKSNVRLVTDDIVRVEEEGIVTKDNVLNRVDVIVTATGFDPTAYFKGMTLIGADGVDIHNRWKKYIMTYKSMFIPECPNFFLMLGPNSPIGNQSVIEISEHQIAFALRLIEAWQEDQITNIEAKSQAVYEWQELMSDKMKNTVWTSGCDSWYLDQNGRPLAWPGSWDAWCAEMDYLNIENFKE